MSLEWINVKGIADQQALASIGQVELMSLYTQMFRRYSQKVSQLLLTRDVTDFPTSRENAENALNALLALDIIPIINENDAIAVDEMDHQTKFGDNDKLGAIVSKLVHADLLIMLSDIDGLLIKIRRFMMMLKFLMKFMKLLMNYAKWLEVPVLVLVLVG